MANTWEKFVVLRAGKLLGVRGPGMFVLIPIIDQVVAVIDERIQTTAFNAERALTKDTVPLNVDAIIFWHVEDAEAAALKITNPNYAPSGSMTRKPRHRLRADTRYVARAPNAA